MKVGEAEDKAALVFLKDLSRRGIQLDELVQCLEVINCQPALQFFRPGASKCLKYSAACVVEYSCAATPKITRLAEDDQQKTLKVGETLKLSVEASCDPGPLNYAWFHNQRPLPTTNSPLLTIHNVTTGHAGNG